MIWARKVWTDLIKCLKQVKLKLSENLDNIKYRIKKPVRMDAL